MVTNRVERTPVEPVKDPGSWRSGQPCWTDRKKAEKRISGLVKRFKSQRLLLFRHLIRAKWMTMESAEWRFIVCSKRRTTRRRGFFEEDFLAKDSNLSLKFVAKEPFQRRKSKSRRSHMQTVRSFDYSSNLAFNLLFIVNIIVNIPLLSAD